MSVRLHGWQLFILQICILPQLVFADGIKLLECIGGMCEIDVSSGGPLGAFFAYLNALYPIALGMAGGITVLMGLWGGIEWMMAGSDPGKAATGRKRLFTSVGGLVLLLMMPAILNLINPTFFQ